MRFLALFFLTSGALLAAPTPREAAARIDAILAADWQKSGLKPNPQANDSAWVRRLYLDVIGRIPTVRELESFVADKAPNKREALIDQLLASEAYAQHFFNYWADVLRLTSNGNQTGPITGSAYAGFIKESLRDNKPYDQLVRELVASQGKAWSNGAIGYYMRDRGMPLDNMANTVRIFLGTRIECAQCHNHPFDKWSQMQFFKMAAFTYGVETQDSYGDSVVQVRELLREREKNAAAAIPEPKRPKRPESPRIKGKMSAEEKEKARADYNRAMQAYAAQEKAYNVSMKTYRSKVEEARDKYRKEMRGLNEPMNDIRDTMRYTSVSTRERNLTLPHDYQYSDAKPRSAVSAGTMMGHECVTQPGETPLQAYARWMTSKDNPRFTTVIVNRLWKRAFGLALIEPLDELMDSTQPMIPELQKQLETLIKDLNYDMKAFLRTLYLTRAYQGEVTREEVPPGVVYHFTGPVLRRMSAEQMWDSFVTLVNPNPDMINKNAREAIEQRIRQAQKINDSLALLSPEEVLAGMLKSAAVYATNREQTEKLQKIYAEARADLKKAQEAVEGSKEGPEKEKAQASYTKARERVDEIRQQVNQVQNRGRQVTASEVLVPGQKRLYEKVTGKPYGGTLVAANKSAAGTAEVPSMMAGESMMMMGNGLRVERIPVPGYDRPELSREERKSQEEKVIESFRDEAAYYGIDEKRQRDYFRSRIQQQRDFLRAAELESPAPRGHPLRDFGQSDRETIENANADASVPQSLFMMNGNLMPSILSKYSQLMLSVSKAQYPDDQVETIYKAVLGRKPDAREKQAWQKAQEAGLSQIEDLIYALLNTQQFIFIQ